MNIGIDGYEANTPDRVGIGNYAFQLLSALYKQDHDNNYTIFLPSPALSDLPKVRLNWRYVVGYPQSLWTIRQLPRLIKKEKLDVFFSPTHYLPWFTKLPKLMSVMDLSYLVYPSLFRKKDFIQLKFLGGFSIKQAQKICTISEFSKQEIGKYYALSPDKIVVTYPGNEHVSPQKIKESVFKSIIEKTGKDYILFVGTLQPRKNVVRLIDAFESLSTQHKLIIVGKKGWMYEPILTKIRNSSRKHNIVYLEFVSDEELVVLYKNAACLVLPSLYEGFGIPVLEALNYNLPVVVSNTTSLPEVAGEAGIYINPLETISIAEGIIKALQLSQIERKEIVNKGKKQLEKFSWKIAAIQTIRTLESIQYER